MIHSTPSIPFPPFLSEQRIHPGGESALMAAVIRDQPRRRTLRHDLRGRRSTRGFCVRVSNLGNAAMPPYTKARTDVLIPIPRQHTSRRPSKPPGRHRLKATSLRGFPTRVPEYRTTSDGWSQRFAGVTIAGHRFSDDVETFSWNCHRRRYLQHYVPDTSRRWGSTEQ